MRVRSFGRLSRWWSAAPLLMTVVAAYAAETAASNERRADGLWMTNEVGGWTVMSPKRQPIVTYWYERPEDSKLPVESGCYFHPLHTPKGVVVTDVAPPDHPHHRGVFLGWVEMHGKKDADFWGWGEHAPVKGRQIVNKGQKLSH